MSGAIRLFDFIEHGKAEVVKNTVLAAAAALTLALTLAPAFAAERNDGNFGGDGSSNVENQCSNILGSKERHPAADFLYCENHR